MTTLSKEDVVRMAVQAGFSSTDYRTFMADGSDLVSFSKLEELATLARADLVAENERLKALSVTNIMVDVVPGDGSGLEVYAKSVDEVVNLLSELGEKAEDLESVQAQLTATRAALAAAEADNERLREDFKCAANYVDFMGGDSKNYRQSIAQPRDDSALREMIAGVYEECAKVFEKSRDEENPGQHTSWYKGVNSCITIAHALAKRNSHR